MRSNSRCGPASVDDRARDEDLAAGRARGHARRQVDLAAVVVAVAVERQPVVHPDPRQRAAVGHQALEADGPVDEPRGVGADDHHLVADRLDHARVIGQRHLDVLDEALDRVDRLLFALLLGQSRVAGEVGEGDGHAQAPEVQRRVLEVGLHVPDDVLLDEVRQEALVHAVHDRRGQRQHLARELLHLLAHARPRDALAHERLVDVEMEEAHLGVGHLRERLPVDAHELQQRHQREAGRQHDGHVAQQLEVVVGEALHRRRVEAHREEHALDQGGLEAGVGGGVLERVGALVRRQQLVDEAEGQPPALGRRADLVERVPALAQAGDDPRLRHGRARPAPVARPRHEAVARPAAQRLRRHPRAARRLADATCAPSVTRLAPRKISGGTSMTRVPPHAGLTSRDVGRWRSSGEGRHLAGGEPPTLRPFTLLGAGVINARGDGCQRQTSRLKPSGADTRPRRPPCTARRRAW